MNANAQNTVTLGLLAASVVLAGMLWFEMTRDYELDTNTAYAANPDVGQSTVVTDNIERPPLSDYAAIIERPLFAADRRPFIAPAPVVETTETNDDFAVSAIIVTDAQRLALIQSKRDNKTHKVTKGDSVNGWMVDEVDPDNVSLRKGDELQDLQIKLKQGTR